MKAVTTVNGDVSLPGLGLSPEDRKMLCENVEIVYHGAATVRYRSIMDIRKKKMLLAETLRELLY